MGRKLCLSSLFFFRIRDAPKSLSSFSSSSSSPRSWPCCILPKTHSFRRADDIFKTVNSIYFDSHDSFLTFSEEEIKSFSATSASGDSYNSVENVIRRLPTAAIRSRLFFDPGETSSSIMVKSKSAGEVLFKQSIAMTVDSEDPSRDFRVSMEEMVAANGVKEWEKLVELFVWFLRANGKENHGFIFGAFLELLVGLAASSSSSSSASSSSSSSFVSRALEIEELQEECEL
ncbi:transcription repressor OFP13-like [Phalaenopsis equestris]|uniref:transcription repressor OFP13-like n=1 Tax=Phalaenopsis equestris TaxID=78828 RepID=UPI0009E5AA2A|nr:transcription repressor OFP13-like [Phalaenopsis equestris]